MQKFLKIVSLLCCFFAAHAAYAALDLKLTQGVRGAIPLAIVPFSGQSDTQSPDNISAVVSTDLQNSGRFSLMSKTDMQQTPNTAADVDFSYWQKQNQSNLVVGSVQPAGAGRYRVTFQLLNAYANKGQSSKNTSAPAWQSAVLLSHTFTVDASQLRGVAHHISDLIYENLTGDKGIFSTRIAYVVAQPAPRGQGQYTLEISDMDGYNPKPLLKSAQPIMSPSWSPDGQRIAYVSFEGGDPTVYIQNVSSGGRQLVSKFQGLNSAPRFSPDGQRLALVLTRTGSPKIFTMAATGGGQPQQITDGSAIDTEPVWSADGRALYFTSNRGGGPQVYKASASGGNVQRVTYTGKYNASPSISSDGKLLAILSGGNNQYNIAIQDIASGRYTVLTQSGNDQAPSIAPNSKMILYASQSGGRGVLGMISIDGRVKITLPTRAGDVREPAWGPFNRKG
jgi:TolB protein